MMAKNVKYYQMLVSPEVGGAAKLAMQIHECVVAARGPVSKLLLPGGGEAERTAKRSGYPHVSYQVARLVGDSPWSSMIENIRLYASVGRSPRGVVHVHAPFLYGAARLFLGASGLKSVVHLHLDYSVKDLIWSFRRPPDVVLTCADFMRRSVEDALDAQGGLASRVVVIPNAVDLARFQSCERTVAKRRLGLTADRPLLMVIANIAPHKGQETAIRAVGVLKERGHDVRLWLVGGERSEGSGHLSYLRNLTQQLRLSDRVDFVGFRNDVPELLAAADYLLLPSTREGLPLVILEAQASKTVVLAAPTAGIPEVVEHGRTGFLIAAADYSAYAEQLEHLLIEPRAAAVVAEAAYECVYRHHGLDSYCERVLHEYETLLNRA